MFAMFARISRSKHIEEAHDSGTWRTSAVPVRHMQENILPEGSTSASHSTTCQNNGERIVRLRCVRPFVCLAARRQPASIVARTRCGRRRCSWPTTSHQSGQGSFAVYDVSDHFYTGCTVTGSFEKETFTGRSAGVGANGAATLHPV